jgi:hypothetical protein
MSTVPPTRILSARISARLIARVCLLAGVSLLLAALASSASAGGLGRSVQAGSGGQSAPLAAGTTPGPTDSEAPGVMATVEQCLPAVTQADRSVTFSGQMVAVAGTQRMTMRIDLQEKTAGEPSFHAVSAPGLGVWRRSGDGVKIYKYLKQITNLPAPAVFRAQVRFRWINEDGRLIRHELRRTSTCVQPDERPKLVVEQVKVTPLAEPSMAEYQVVLRNEGRSAASGFGVTLGIYGALLTQLNAPSLDAGAREVLDTQAPRCTPSSKVTVLVDPRHQIEEATGGGLTDTIACPLGSGSAPTAPVGNTSGN